jgi:outer membrane protein OmpA-like peptidoglycan-associated protein
MRSASVALVAVFAAALEVACAGKHAAVPPPAQTERTLVVLLPDSDTGVTGRAFVENKSGNTDLNAARESSTATPSAAPSAVTNFKFESDELTDESRALLPQILNTVKERTIPEVLVVGHTDTMGTPRANFDLGLTRANTVRNLLIQVGVDPALIEVRSHGESDLLVKTPDETPEGRNRRVEISVR